MHVPHDERLVRDALYCSVRVILLFLAVAGTELEQKIARGAISTLLVVGWNWVTRKVTAKFS